jgi:flagellar motor switch/type III secretory pathway protein FliN
MSSAAQTFEKNPNDPLKAGTASSTQSLDSMPWLPCALRLEVPIVGFTIGNLLMLNKGSVVESSCHHTSDVPLRVNQLLIGWTEFEVIGDRLAVRITDQA